MSTPLRDFIMGWVRGTASGTIGDLERALACLDRNDLAGAQDCMARAAGQLAKASPASLAVVRDVVEKKRLL